VGKQVEKKGNVSMGSPNNRLPGMPGNNGGLDPKVDPSKALILGGGIPPGQEMPTFHANNMAWEQLNTCIRYCDELLDMGVKPMHPDNAAALNEQREGLEVLKKGLVEIRARASSTRARIMVIAARQILGLNAQNFQKFQDQVGS
jgi:hypothetical protein